MKKTTKSVLITGASRGIGAATARLLASEGWRVLLNYNQSDEACTKLCQDLKSLGCDVDSFKADVSDFEEVSAMFDFANERFGGLDALVCNAGVALQKLLTDTTTEDFNKIISINVEGAFNCCKLATSSMVREKSGKIVLISSVWGLTGASCEVVYSASKSALIGMSKALAKELAPSNIQVNCVAPGVIDTEMNSNLDADTRGLLEDEIPLGRIGSALEVAQAISFLVSEKSDYITGQIISPNGGFYI